MFSQISFANFEDEMGRIVKKTNKKSPYTYLTNYLLPGSRGRVGVLLQLISIYFLPQNKSSILFLHNHYLLFVLYFQILHSSSVCRFYGDYVLFTYKY